MALTLILCRMLWQKEYELSNIWCAYVLVWFCGGSRNILRIQAREVVGVSLILGLDTLIRSLDFPAVSGYRGWMESFRPRREAI